MKFIKSFLIFILSVLTHLAFSQTALKPGDKSPDFTAKDQDGVNTSLSHYKGKKVVLYFYPKDFTPGCTAEACNLRDNYDKITETGYTIIGVSTDSETSHKDFKEKYTLPFTLVSDSDITINQKYGVWVEKERDGKKFWGTARTTFLINENGIITQVIDKVDTQEHSKQVLSFQKVD